MFDRLKMALGVGALALAAAPLAQAQDAARPGLTVIHAGQLLAAPGFAADIVAVNGDPLADIAELLDVDFVMARGIVRKSEE